MTAGEKLRSLREDRGMSVDDLAKTLGLTRQAVYNYEMDARVPRDEIKVQIANFFGVGIEEIFFTQRATIR